MSSSCQEGRCLFDTEALEVIYASPNVHVTTLTLNNINTNFTADGFRFNNSDDFRLQEEHSHIKCIY